MKQALKGTAMLVAKIAVSLALLTYLFSTTNLPALVARVRAGDASLLVAAVLLYILVLCISTWRWHLLLRAQGCEAPIGHLSASYLVATFFNNFLPSNIGGDVIRVKDSIPLTGSTTTSLAVVAIDRILGFGALYALAAGAYLCGGSMVRGLVGARVVLLGLGVLFTVLAYFFFRPGTTGAILKATRLISVTFIREPFEVVQQAVRVYRAQIGTVWAALAASLVLQALVVCYYFLVARALRIPLPLSACFLMVPLCTLVQAVPISFNGWGIRESLFIVYFGQVGLSRDAALAFSLVAAGLIILLSLSGAVVWTSRRETGEALAG